MDMRELLEAVAAGDLSPAEAETRLRGDATTGSGRFDAGREERRGVPEAILAVGKSASEVATLTRTALETTGHALVTRVSEADVAAVTDEADDRVTLQHDERGRTLVARRPDYEPPALGAEAAIVTGGTADTVVATEAETVLEVIGVDATRVDDVGVAHLGRVLDQIGRLRAADVLIVAAGREGALPTVVAGLVDTPVIGVPVSSGTATAGTAPPRSPGWFSRVRCCPSSTSTPGSLRGHRWDSSRGRGRSDSGGQATEREPPAGSEDSADDATELQERSLIRSRGERYVGSRACAGKP